MCLTLLWSAQRAEAADQTFSGGTSGNNTSWLTAGNWVGGAIPGTTTAASVATNTDTANVGSTGTSPDLGINLNVTGGTYGLGAINFNSASRNVGDSSTATNAANGTVRLNGATINGVSNVILRDYGTGNLSLQGAAFAPTITGVMSIALGNATNNVVDIDSSGSIAVNAVVKDGATGAKLTLGGIGSGVLILSGANTYTGGTTIAQGNLRVTNTTGSGTGTLGVLVGNNTGNAVLSGTGIITGAVTTATTGSNVAYVAPGINTTAANFGAAGTLRLNGGLNIGTGTNFNFDLASTTAAASDAITLNSTSLTAGTAFTFNFNLLTPGTLATTGAYTLISGASTSLTLAGITITTTGTGAYTPSYSFVGGSLLVSFSSNSTPNYFGVTGQGYDANSMVFDTTTADFNSKNDGTGTAKAFDPFQTAIFAGTSGTVTVGASGVAPQAGLEFDSTGYTLTGSTITLTSVPTITVTNATDTATINSAVAGSVGLTKAGGGTLVLGGTNTYTGATTINAGTLSISADANLGNAANGIVLGGGTLAASTTVSLAATRALSGAGSIDVTAGNILTLNGSISTTAVTVADTGTLATAGASVATKSIGSLTFTASGTIANTGDTLAVGDITTTAGSTGVATISGPISLASGTHTFTLPGSNATGADLALTGVLSGSGAISKATGAGTLELDGNNPYTGTITLGSPTVSGGTILLGNGGGLGASGSLNFNAGTVTNGTAGPLTSAKVLSIGATTASSGAVLAGSDLTFTAGVSFYSPTAATQSVVVNNHTTFNGVVSTGSATSAGVAISGTGTLTLGGTAANTFVQPVSITGATLEAAKAGALAANPSVTVNTGGTLLLGGASGVTDRLNNAGAVIVNGGGTLHTGGLSEGTQPSAPGATDGAAGVGALTLAGTSTAASTINFGVGNTGSSLVFTNLTTGSKGAVVNILNWNGALAGDGGTATNDRLLFATDPGFTTTDLANFNFSGFAPGGIEIPYGNEFEIVPVPEPATVLGGGLLVGAAAWSQRRRRRSAVLAS